MLLRVAVGSASVFQGTAGLADAHSGISKALLINGGTAIAGACLLMGLFTPIMSVLAFVGYELVTHVPRYSSSGLVYDAKLQIVFALLLAFGIALVGPGAYSIDARLFGRREVIIPRVSRPDGK